MLKTFAASVKGIVSALVILLGVELYLHNDDFLHRYRSVFAVGRAADKLKFASTEKPELIFLGNSRVDNAIDPNTVAKTLGVERGTVFNFGIPGTNTIVLSGMMHSYLDNIDYAFSSKDTTILLGLDETLFTLADQLNYSVYFANRWELFNSNEYRILFSTVLRLWGYADNLKGLREPGRFRDFILATVSDREPWGGALSDNLGFRAKKGRLDDSKVRSPLTAVNEPLLNPVSLSYFYRMIDKIQSRGLKIAVFFPPLHHRKTAFEEFRESEQYQRVLGYLRERKIPVITTSPELKFNSGDFVNAGHLNVFGAEKFSRELAKWIKKAWPDKRNDS